ncbi:MAG: hypothetical protein ABS28_02835 [Cryomorphaceae bacterium BACL22 MAG-120619-bin32]|jgi:hypothetical protein|nr:MAG: hypothetical protein ABS28_02835 [Cryomorphaceae bacterium BACL22 MAG-120619-bin32]
MQKYIRLVLVTKSLNLIKMKKIFLQGCLLAAIFLSSCTNIQDRTKYLLLDNSIIDRVDGCQLVVGTVTKSPHNPLFGEDKPWEQRYDNFYGNVIYDKKEKVYKCWYSPFIVDETSLGLTF